MAHVRPLQPKSEAKSPIGYRIRQLRMEKGVSQKELGIRIGIHPDVASARVNQYERGKNEPAYQLVKLIGRELGVPPAFFFTEDGRLAELIRQYAS